MRVVRLGWSMLLLLAITVAVWPFAIGVPPPTLASADRLAAADRPIFDTHIHYSEDAWSYLNPVEALGVLDQAGIVKALVSSTPDDGTLKLADLAPERILPVLRPYRTRGDMGSWYRDPTVINYVENRLPTRKYYGIGEFHLYAGQADNVAPRAFAAFAVERGIFLHAHSDARAIDEIFSLRSDVKVLWAHAGMSETPATLARLLDAHPNLWIELALRYDVAPNGQLAPVWRQLFERYPDRFMIGTDTWVPSQWLRLPQLMNQVRHWLDQLPSDLADNIATGNAERLFGAP